MSNQPARKRGPAFYVLLCALVGVWGLVIYRFTYSLDEAGPAFVAPARAASSDPLPAPVQRTRLAAYVDDFRDPFMLHPVLFQAAPDSTVQAAASSSTAQAPPAPPPPPLTLQGVFDETALLLDADLFTYLVTVGDTIRGVRVVAVRPDHVVLHHQGASFTLRLYP